MTHEQTETRQPFSAIEQQRHRRIEARRHDPRIGAVVYQIIVDRFAPSSRLDSKREHYAPPRRLKQWSDTPQRGHRIEPEGIIEGQLEFWGGDLESLRAKLDYLQQLGVQWVYLNPIFEAWTNHKYDTGDYCRVDPQYGTNDELKQLAASLHERGMYLMLDGVFNHMGRHARCFEKALETGDGAEFFYIGEQFRNGWRGWRNVPNLPELNLEDPAVRDWLYAAKDGIVRQYLTNEGIDGWRLDVAPDLGPAILRELTDSAHEAKPGSWIVGECWNYPQDWLTVLDGILLMHWRELMLALAAGTFSPAAFNRALQRALDECDYEGLLRSHLVLDNHDTARLPHLVPDLAMRELLRVLQFTLPGCPTLYYGSELGMEGGHDPFCRGPMRWDLVRDDNAEYVFLRRLLQLRQKNPALIHGDCRVLDAERLVCFLRTSDRAIETVLVVANPSASETVTELIPVRYSLWMDAAPMECLLTGEHTTLHAGTLTVTLPPRGVRLFRSVDRGHATNYSMFKRVM